MEGEKKKYVSFINTLKIAVFGEFLWYRRALR